jgi:hypothetical protein
LDGAGCGFKGSTLPKEGSVNVFAELIDRVDLFKWLAEDGDADMLIEIDEGLKVRTWNLHLDVANGSAKAF